MDQKCDRLHPSVPLENTDLEQRLEKKLNDVNIFNNHIINNKEMITYFKDKNNKSKKRSKNYKTLNTVVEPVDSIVINVNFYNFIGYWCWFDNFTNISWNCLYPIIT